MLKGITLTFLYLSTKMCPLPASESVRGCSTFFQDTTKTVNSTPSQSQINITKPITIIGGETNPVKKNYDQAQLDSIFSKSEERDKKFYSKKTSLPANLEIVITPEDTSSSRIYYNIPPYQHQRTTLDELYNDNFFLAITYKTISQHFDTSLMRLYGINTQTIVAPLINKPLSSKEKSGFIGAQRAESSMNWLPVVLLFSLFVFSWIKILYQKYVFQVVTSLINYQVSLRLLRERNVLFRNMAFGLNIVFALNLGLFVFFFAQYFGFEQIKISSNNIINVLIYSTFSIILYGIKTFFCRVLGYIFLVRDEFAEYIHNIYLLNKNIGLFLFPIIIIFPYITEPIKPIVLYLGILVLLIMFFLRTIRGFQIIMRKGVSMFYLILYLCAIEILPVLLVVKYSATLI